MALYGNDIDDTTTVLEADLAWICRLDKGEFIGRDALLEQSRNGVPRLLVGFEMTDRGIARDHYPVILDGDAGWGCDERQPGPVPAEEYRTHLSPDRPHDARNGVRRCRSR